MEKLTPQIAALYLGQKCETEFKGMPISFKIESVDLFNRVTDGDRYDFRLDQIKLRLRPLSSLTESEARELYEAKYPAEKFEDSGYESALVWWVERDEYYIKTEHALPGCPAAWLKLLSWGFDLFGLIESSLAVDATKIETETTV